MKGLRAWPRNARWLLLLATAALALAAVGHVTTFRIVGRHHFGVFTFWAEARQCVAVAQITPANWPMIAEDKLRQLDCVLQVGDLDTTIEANYQRRNAYLAELRARGVQEVALQVQRGDRLFSVQVPIGVYTAKNVLEITIVLALSGLSLGVLGLLVLAAAPDVEANRVWAAFLFLGLLVLGGAINGYDDHLFRYTYDFLAIMGPRPWLGALLFQLAFVFPKPFLQGRWRLIRYLWYLPALVVFLGFLRLYGGFILGSPWLSDLEVWANHGVTLIFGSGVLVLLLRSLYIILRHASQRYTWQAVFIIAGWLLALPISFLEMILNLLGLNWLLGGVTNLTLMFWVVPGATLIAYGMLRYQSFAYRGAALNALVILLMSATLTQVYSLFISRRGWDGVQFATVWGGVLLATLFWYIDSPLRRGFRRLFVRHEFDYQIADRFSRRLNEVSGVEATLRTAVAELQSGLEVAWAAVQAASRPGQLWLAEMDAPQPAMLAAGGLDLAAHLPSPPVHEQALLQQAERLGQVWIGPRISAEPFDEQDTDLAGLLAQELARALAVHAQIEGLERVPGLILAAVEADRKRIGQDLHDGVLQFMGAIPLDLDRAGALATKDPNAAQAILERAIERAIHISQDTRAIVYDLSPPGLAHSGLLSQTRLYVQQACHSHGVALDWQEEPAGWADLSEERALQVYRIVQQGVGNALEHGRPTRVQVCFGREDGQLLLEIGDDGVGFEPERSGLRTGLGLISMQERARAIGGRLRIESAPGRGTKVRLRLPALG